MPTTTPSAINLTVLVGRLSRSPELRVLPSGDTVLTLEVSVPRDDGPTESVPVAWHGAPAAAERWAEGDELVVTGRTRRRFFRAGGITQSRTEVLATTAVPARRATAARKALDAAVVTLRSTIDD